MKTIENFLKEKFPDALAAYKEYEKEELKKEKDKAKKKLEEEIKNRSDFEDYSFIYEYESSYKGWSEGPYEGDISFITAFEYVENYTIDPYAVNGGKTFEEFLKLKKMTEKEFFDKWFKILNGKSDELYNAIMKRWEDNRLEDTPTFDGFSLFTKDEIKNFFRKCTYKRN